MRNHHCVADEFQQAGQHTAQRGRSCNQGISDAGQCRDERRDGHLWIDQGGELTEHFTPAHLDCADLSDGRMLGAAASGFQVEHHEGDLRQGQAQIVGGQLHGHECEAMAGL